MITLSMSDLSKIAHRCALILAEEFEGKATDSHPLFLVGIPRGGIPAALLIEAALSRLSIPVRTVDEAVAAACAPHDRVLIDDIYVTGETKQAALARGFDAAFFFALVRKWDGVGLLPDAGPHTLFGEVIKTKEWIQFPWEVADKDQGRPEDAVRRLIEYIGDDPQRPALLNTPARVLRFYDELREAANGSWEPTAFESHVDDLVIVRDIPLYSLCEHHLLPFLGSACVGYLPHGKILGLSKVARTVATCAAAISVQEELAHRVAVRIREYAETQDVAVVTRAVHTCMVMRGAKAIGSETTASAMLGQFREDPALRAEFLSLAKGA